jgi:hypothetical protein
MIPPATATSAGFSWIKLPYHRGCELKRDNEVMGTLQRSSKWASDYVASTPNGEWTFRRTGFWGSGTEIVDTNSRQTVATFTPIWPSRGTLTFSDGQGFNLECKGLWHPLWTVRTPDAKPVLSLHVREQKIEFSEMPAIDVARLQLLAIFVLYRVQQAEEDAASAAMVAAIA